MKPKPTVAKAKAPTAPETARQVKSSIERSRGFAQGGKTHGFGRGDHTVTDAPDAAVPAKGGATGKPATGENTKAAEGGPPIRSHSLGGLAPEGSGST